MAPPQRGPQGDADDAMAPVWILFGSFIFLAIIWYFFKEYIIAVVFLFKHYEISFLNLFLPSDIAKNLQSVNDYIQSAKASGYADVSLKSFADVCTQVGIYFRYPVAIILAVLAVIIYLSDITARFRKTYDMKRLLSEEKTNWPQVMPVSKLNLVDTDINKGPWAMALSPLEFAKKYNLLIHEAPKLDNGLMSKQIRTATVNRDDARKVFALQLGAFWQGPEKLPIHVRALFAAFAARIDGDGASCTKLLMQIAGSSEEGKLDFSGVDELLKKHKNNKLVVKITKRHAYVLTVMSSILEAVRDDGVLASADFLWLKPVDRRLWFMLNCVGRQTPFSEVSGPFAHWLVEKELNRKLRVPVIEEAVNALSLAIQDIIYTPEEDETT